MATEGETGLHRVEKAVVALLRKGLQRACKRVGGVMQRGVETCEVLWGKLLYGWVPQGRQASPRDCRSRRGYSRRGARAREACAMATST
jgi:hypothetical protein